MLSVDLIKTHFRSQFVMIDMVCNIFYVRMDWKHLELNVAM